MKSEKKSLSSAGANTAVHAPWRAEGNRSVFDARGEIVAMTNLAMPSDDARSIAHLIAAAPDLLVALRWIMERDAAGLPLHTKSRNKAYAAIAKAEASNG